MCMLKIISHEKELFVLEMERGVEVKIPRLLALSQYPHSFRYYDSLVNTIKELYSLEQKDFSKLKKSISYAYDTKYGNNNIF